MIVRITDDGALSAAAAIYSRSWQESHKSVCTAEFVAKHTPEYCSEYLQNKLNRGWLIFCLYLDGVAAGIVGLKPNSGEIGLLYVEPKLQGKGVGSRLLSFATWRMHAAKCTPFLLVLASNVHAIAFYSARGWQPNGEEKILDPKTGVKEIKFVLK